MRLQVNNSPTAPVFLEAIHLGVALLNGGNREVQVCSSVHALPCLFDLACFFLSSLKNMYIV